MDVGLRPVSDRVRGSDVHQARAVGVDKTRPLQSGIRVALLHIAGRNSRSQVEGDGGGPRPWVREGLELRAHVTAMATVLRQGGARRGNCNDGAGPRTGRGRDDCAPPPTPPRWHQHRRWRWHWRRRRRRRRLPFGTHLCNE